MTRCRPITMNGWRNWSTKRPYRRSSQEGRGNTEHPKLSMPSQQAILGQKQSVIPSGSSTLRTSPQVVLKDLMTWPGFLSWGTGGSEQHQGSPKWGGSWPFQWAWGQLRGLLTAEKSAEGPGEVQPEEPLHALSWPKQSMPRKQSGSGRKPWDS